MNLLDKVLNLLAVIIGGILTYWVTNKSNKNEHRRKAMLERRDEILVPLCSNIEKLLNYIEKHEKLVSCNHDKEFLDKSKECNIFLEARKRVYLDKRSIQLLTEYDQELKRFQDNLKAEAIRILDLVKNDLEKVLIDFSGKHLMNYSVSFDKDYEITLENAIINKESIEGQFLLSGITLIYNDDEENFDYTNFFLGSDFYSNIWSAIQTSYIGVEDLGLSPDQEQSLYLFKYINDNFSIINTKINRYIQECELYIEYMNIINKLNLIRDHLINEIDKTYDL